MSQKYAFLGTKIMDYI